MNEIIEITAKDNHQFSAYISQPSGKPKAGIVIIQEIFGVNRHINCLLYTSPSPRDLRKSRMPSSA